MTFLSLRDTSISGRTCHLWIHVAYEKTPKKNVEVRIDSNHTDKINLIHSALKRHVTKVDLSIRQEKILSVLCAGTKEMNELKLTIPYLSIQSHSTPLDMSLTHLRFHRAHLKRLAIRGAMLTTAHFAIITQLSSLTTFEYSQFDFGAMQSKNGLPLRRHRWSFEELNAFCQPDNQLTHLRDIYFDVQGPLSSNHLGCLRNLPLEAITSVTPTGGMTLDAVKDIVHFHYLRSLTLHIEKSCVFEVLCQTFRPLLQLNTLTLQELHFQMGQLTDLLLNQEQLTSLTFREVKFESPECLSELPHSLVDLEFKECAEVRFAHLSQLKLPLLKRLTHAGLQAPSSSILTNQQRQHFCSMTSAAPIRSSDQLPSLKEFKFDWGYRYDDDDRRWSSLFRSYANDFDDYGL